VPSIEAALIDRPTRWAIAVMNLLQRDARGDDNVFHPSSVVQRSVRVGVKRLDEDAATPACQSGTHEHSRIFTCQQSCLDTDAAGQQQLAEIHNSRFALVRGHKIRQFFPRLDGPETLARIRHDRR